MAECQIDEIVSVAEKIFGRLGQRAMSLGTVQEHYGETNEETLRVRRKN